MSIKSFLLTEGQTRAGFDSQRTRSLMEGLRLKEQSDPLTVKGLHKHFERGEPDRDGRQDTSTRRRVVDCQEQKMRRGTPKKESGRSCLLQSTAGKGHSTRLFRPSFTWEAVTLLRSLSHSQPSKSTRQRTVRRQEAAYVGYRIHDESASCTASLPMY